MFRRLDTKLEYVDAVTLVSGSENKHSITFKDDLLHISEGHSVVAFCLRNVEMKHQFRVISTFLTCIFLGCDPCTCEQEYNRQIHTVAPAFSTMLVR